MVVSSCVLQHNTWICGLRSVSNLLVISLHWSGGTADAGPVQTLHTVYALVTGHFCGRYRPLYIDIVGGGDSTVVVFNAKLSREDN